MAKGQLRSTREAKKPKKTKPKAPYIAGTPAAESGKSGSFVSGKKKG